MTGALLAVASLLASSAGTPPVVGVSEREWSIALFRSSVAAGRASFSVVNRGEDPHNLELRAPDGTVVAATAGELKPGDHLDLAARLAHPGRYTLVCTLPGHAERGMRATLRVTKRRRRRSSRGRARARAS